MRGLFFLTFCADFMFNYNLFCGILD